MNHKFTEFFKSDKGNFSMTRLLCFMSWFPSSWVLIKTQNENMFIAYLGIFVAGYAGGKWADVIEKNKEKKQDDSNNSTNSN